MHVRECSEDAIRIPFHVGEDRSRTWVVTRTANGLRLKHDHRHEDGSEELYDRVNDPNEWKNLAGEEKHAGLKREMAQWMPKTSVKPVPERDDYDFDFDSYTYQLKRQT